MMVMVMAALPRAVSHRDDRGSHKQLTMHPTLVTDGSTKATLEQVWARPRDLIGQKETEN